jgi:hypothetical protein
MYLAIEPKRRSLTSSLTQMFRKSASLESHITTTDSLNSNDSFSYIAEEETKNGNMKNK